MFPPEEKIASGVLQNRLSIVAEGAKKNNYDHDVYM
jgi:hypothetical protein